jgi:tripeptide aminopeptidase
MATITLDERDRRELMERFLRYVKIDTQSDEESESCPSTEKQKDLGRLLVQELEEVGCERVRMDDCGYVYGFLPERLPQGHPAAGKVPAVGLIAHMDTYFGTPGGGVKPQVIESYDGGPITLPGDPNQVLDPAQNPNLERCVGQTIITSDGTTLLGADDKAGIAEIMTVLSWLQRHPEAPHGPISIAFTPDEEIGRGADHFDVEGFGAKYAYTLDGSDLGEIEDETFCADSVNVTIEGYDVHPGYAKDKLVNAVRVAAAIVDNLPERFLPETTEGKEPYLHPYTISGDVSKVEMKVLARAFTVEELHRREDALRAVVAAVQERFPGAKITVEVQESYRNMAYKIAEDPRVLEYALEAVKRAGLEPHRHAIRGGTDGSRLSFMGILTPNIFAGGQNFHSVREWVCLEWMAKAVETTLHLLQIWVERSA